jgi:hypothetical protein
MFNYKRWRCGTAFLLTLGLTAGTVAPIATTVSTPVLAQSTSFSDVQSNYWATPFINALAARGIITGYPDGSFRPEAPVTRAEFAAMLKGAFNVSQSRRPSSFADVASNYWANPAIQQAYEEGFLSGYPGGIFRPEQNIPRQQVLVSLANGLRYSANNPISNDLSYYNDASAISNYARPSIAAASEKQLVVDFPDLHYLRPQQNATRAEVAAFIYQALVSQGQAAAIFSPNVVALSNSPTPTPPTPTPIATDFRIPAGTTIPVTYNQSRILVSPNEQVPLTVTVSANITTSNGRVLIPAGTQITGQLQPLPGGQPGTEFVAQTLTMPNGQQEPINATSNPITKTQTISKGSDIGSIVRDAALGAGAAAAISGVTGNRHITVGKVLGGVGAGGLLGAILDRGSATVVSVNPNTDLNLTLNQGLVINSP